MNDLQQVILIISGVFFAGVVFYNKWQEHKARKTVQKAFSSDQDDVLMGIESDPSASLQRVEPSLDEDAPVAAVAAEDGAPSEAEAAVAPAKRELPIDELIDCAIAIMTDGPLRGEKLLPHFQKLRFIGSKPVHFVGQREDGNWEEVATGGVYFGAYAGVQLANRSGPLTEVEYSELITQLRQVADEFDAELDVPDMNEVMARARALHQFIHEYDAQLSISVRSKGAPWAISSLHAALARQGFDVRPDGRMVMPDGDGGALFYLITNVKAAEDATSRLTLLLDVPCVAPLRDGFGAMTACARMLANRLEGVVVDDSDQAIQDESLTEIAEQVSAFYANMEAVNVEAGSTRALRLFA